MSSQRIPRLAPLLLVSGPVGGAAVLLVAAAISLSFVDSATTVGLVPPWLLLTIVTIAGAVAGFVSAVGGLVLTIIGRKWSTNTSVLALLTAIGAGVAGIASYVLAAGGWASQSWTYIAAGLVPAVLLGGVTAAQLLLVAKQETSARASGPR